jgi:hypothetical protein
VVADAVHLVTTRRGCRRSCGLAAVLLAIGAGRTARADEATRPHAGRFLRLAAGLAYLHESWSPSGGAPDAVHTGWGPALGVSFGKFVRPGLALAGDCQLATAINRDETTSGVTYSLPDTLHFVDTLSALVEYYPNPRRGLHVGGALGLAAVTEVDTHMGGTQTSWGFAVAAQAGHERWVSRRWSVGGLVRLAYYHYGTDTPPPSASSNGLLVTALLAFTFD